jgi:hydrogenase nickel incorporation protein HypA/HybF
VHELALAEAVVTAALEAAEREGLHRIDRIDVRVGELQHIRRQTFEFALKEVMPVSEPLLAATEFRVGIEPARFRCRPCGHAFGLAETGGPQDEGEQEAIHFVPELAHAFLRCPHCGSPDFDLVEGRGVSIRSIEGERDD